MAGRTYSFGAGDWDFWVLKLNSDGSIAWEKTYGGPSTEWASEIQQTSNGCYVVVGGTMSFGSGFQNIWVLKLDANGEIPYCSAIGTSEAIVSDTSALVENTTVIPQTSSAIPTDTDVSPQDMSAETSVVCGIIHNIFLVECISELGTSTISVSAYDPWGGNLTYDWVPLNGGAIIGSGSAVEFDPLDSGPHPCPYGVELTVTSDASGLSQRETIDIYVKLAGDANGDGVVNVLDKVEVRNHFGESGPDGWIDADVDYNGVVNVLDKVKVRNQFGQNGCLCPQ